MKATLLLAIPLVHFKAIWEEGLQKIRGLVMGLIGEVTNVAQASATWGLILTWCILAAHQDTNGNSILGL